VSVLENFRIGLQVTGLGMAMVFLTLIIVAVLIWSLDRLFRFRGKTGVSEKKAAPAVVKEVTVAESTLADQAAAVAVALALAQRGRRVRVVSAVPQGVGMVMPWERMPDEINEQVTGEIVTVLSIDPGPGTWKAHGRVRATE